MKPLHYLYLCALLVGTFVLAGPIGIPSLSDSASQVSVVDERGHDIADSPLDHPTIEARGQKKPKPKPEPEYTYGEVQKDGMKWENWLDNPNTPTKVERSTLTVDTLLRDGWKVKDGNPDSPDGSKPDSQKAPGHSLPGKVWERAAEFLPNKKIYKKITVEKATTKDGKSSMNSYTIQVGPGVLFALSSSRVDGPPWSDVAMAVYRYYHSEELRYVFQIDVVNDPTRDFVEKELYPKKCMEWPDYDDQPWQHGSAEFQALLGTPNAKGVAALVLGNFDRGKKNITRIVTWADDQDEMIQMLVELGG